MSGLLKLDWRHLARQCTAERGPAVCRYTPLSVLLRSNIAASSLILSGLPVLHRCLLPAIRWELPWARC